MQSNQIVPAHTSLSVQSNELDVMRQKAELLIRSGFLPKAIDKPEKAIAIMWYGRELRIPDWMALKHISVVHGNPQADGQLSKALLERSGLMEEFTILRSDATECKLRMKRKGQAAYEVHCTLDEAGQLRTQEDGKNIALTEKYNWRQQPKTMLFWFTVKQGARRLFSDVLNGMAGSMEGALQVEDEIADDVLVEIAAVRAGQGESTPRPDWWNSFSESMFQRFDMEADAIDAALEYASGWQQDKRLAQAACIAAHCAYDRACVETYTAANAYKVETYDAALKVIAAYDAARVESDIEEGEFTP